METVLITGGGGYIGTNVALKLLQKNYKVVVVDNFSNSKRMYINKVKKKFNHNLVVLKFDLLNKKQLSKLFKEYKFDAVIHLAGKKYVAQSFLIPNEYKKQNVLMTKKLLDVMKANSVTKLIFSSSITVYGKPKRIPVSEEEKNAPLSPYAKNKYSCEKLILNWHKITGYGATVLRLSNPIGANCEYVLGDDPKTKKYLGIVPYIIKKIQQGDELTFNGNNHPTRDGTTIRDYIHVDDVANAFVSALIHCQSDFSIYNIGFGGQGTSVLEILGEVQKELGIIAKYKFGPKRKGDVAEFISQTQKARTKLGFETKYNLSDMISSQISFTNKNSGNLKRYE